MIKRDSLFTTRTDESNYFPDILCLCLPVYVVMEYIRLIKVCQIFGIGKYKLHVL